ncbi:MAG TPA: EF-Tu/IF-2/RF-3 family GTPase, partial [Spirochaetota bacterium]|nr:EF-Tu/IF-2/RF-3 family GTPase [Spirochaetota bacterium]
VAPAEKNFAGFIFKIHANMDPRHRDRIAFMRVCAGIFARNRVFKHVPSGKDIKFSAPTAFMAQNKEVIEQAFPGDIVGLHDRGKLKIGDTLTQGEDIHFLGIPSFSPEIFRYMKNTDPMKSKQLNKGICHLTEEGLAQVFTMSINNNTLVGTVGELQFDVIQYRLKNEYGASCSFEPVDFHKACWITSASEITLKNFIRQNDRFIAFDKNNRPVFLAESPFFLQRALGNNPEIAFYFTSDYTEKISLSSF